MKTLGLRDPAFLSVASPAGYSDQPDNYASLVRWYDAASYDDDGLSDDDVVVNNWTDLSATGDDAVPDGTYPPHWKDGAMPTGKNCLSFPDGWHHFDFTEVTTGDFTILFVLKGTSGVGTDQIYASSTSGNYQIRDAANGHPTVWSPYMLPGAGTPLINGLAITNDEWYLASYRRTGSSGVPRFGHDKTYLGEDTGDTNTNSMKFNTIGLYNGGLAGPFYLAEVCLYTAVLSDANIDSLFDGYFNVKYLGDIGS